MSCSLLWGSWLFFVLVRVSEQQFKNCPYKWLYKKQLAEKCKWEVKAHEFKPVCKQCEKIKSHIVRIIKTCCQKTHCRAHQTYRCADNGAFKNDRMGFSQFKIFAGKLKRAWAPHNTFQSISKDKFNQNHCPYWHHSSKHIDATLCIYCMNYRISACNLHQS